MKPQIVVLPVRREFMKNYSYVVVDPVSRRAVAVDPAWEMNAIERAVEEAGARLSGILVTHGHPDHVHLAGPLAARHECPIWMSRAEIAASGFDAGRLVAIGTVPWTVGRLLIEPIFTPGHTPGCTCYRIGDNLFSGDVLFAEGCGICPDVQAAHAMFDSLERLKSALPPHTRVFPGHSYGVPPGQRLSRLLADNIYLQFSNREAFAAFRLRRGQSTARMFSFS